MKEIKKPNFIIIGAMKAATTSLYTYLKQHPDVFMTSIKEPMFFNSLNTENDFVLQGRKTKKITSFDEYYSLFERVENETAIGEASPAYIYNKNCATLIKEHLPAVKIIAILRQPVERAYSNFLHAKRADREPIENFEDAFNAEEERIEKNWSPLYHYKTKGHYYQQLKRYIDLFPENQIKVILFKDIISNPQKVSKEVFDFLEVDNSFTPNTSKKANGAGKPKGVAGWIVMKLRKNNLIPNIEFSKYLPEFIVSYILKTIYSKPEKIDNKTINTLTNKYYKEDIKQLEKLIERDLSNWL
jgi:hypothetical protein